MIKYIVFWTLMSWIPTSCPDTVKPDAYGRISNLQYGCTVAHFEEIEKQHQREFQTKEELIEWLKNKPVKGESGSLLVSDKIKNIRIYQLIDIKDLKDKKK